MFGFSVVQLVRRNGHKLDKNIRQELLKVYSPFRNIPCFLHRPIEYVSKKAKKLPLIIEFEADCFELGINDVKNTNTSTLNQYPSISCCSTKLSIEKIEHLLDNCSHIKKIYYDRKVTALLDIATPSIHSDKLQQSGLTGKGVTIAVIDTGIYPHEDLQGRIKGFKDFINNRTAPYDDNGHGTHCAGDAAGNGRLSGGKYKGPAPEANIVGVKVLDKMGSGSLSTVISGVEWCIQNQAQLNIDILSLSLGSDAQQSAEDDPVVRAVEKAWDNGMVVCVAAGNSGPQPSTIASPGISPKVITVGAANDRNTVDRTNDIVADFSSRGPTIDGLIKPDLVTPGVNIISLRSPRSFLDKTNASARVDSNYFSLSGTSMATPICAGVVAQMLQMNPNQSPDDIKLQLINACEDIEQDPNAQGNGYVNAEKLLTMNVRQH
ncbi:S8 family peptidase [Metabacillus sediminilitoris]|uniref:Peptidase S8 n=1 Tax=Metabacillus sediminilitoris TaxID=2567941 RepID=A0A4S4C389_9BACI|nr:S8 family peptidase [Metabacillus sediminilitoris]QGQ48089.1 S8 family serine peptidase [Metabacillus sediminilitoris]THF81549.1 peptidase S8 [Metabacillus sediminilitoris]